MFWQIYKSFDETETRPFDFIKLDEDMNFKNVDHHPQITHDDRSNCTFFRTVSLRSVGDVFVVK